MGAPTPRDPGCAHSSQVVLPPDAGGTIEALSALGYSHGAAVADIVDNSVAAGARRVEVELYWAGAQDSSVAVRDDGRGMDPAQLLEAMTLGAGGLDVRDGSDLGRFGMGLKTASFSQCRQLTVASRTAGDQPWSSVTWDLDHVQQVGRWEALLDPSSRTALELQRHTSRLAGAGTVVLWQRLTTLVTPGAGAADRAAHRQFLRATGEIEQHLSMVFCRYLQRRSAQLDLRVNDNAVTGWDPFSAGGLHVSALDSETPRPGVRIQGFVMPHPRRFVLADGHTPDTGALAAVGGPRGWNEQQGFYVYRNDRLIVAGDWLGLGRREERHRLARLAVHLTAEHDGEWGVDVRKTTATVPTELRSHLTRLAKVTQKKAEAVLQHRGTVARNPAAPGLNPADVTWQQVHHRGLVKYRLNRDHPLIRHLLERHPEVTSDLRAVLSLIELALPMAQINATGGEPTTVATGADPAPDGLAEAGRRFLAILVDSGLEPGQAHQRLAAMPPFSDHPEVLAQLTGSTGSPPGGAVTKEST